MFMLYGLLAGVLAGRLLGGTLAGLGGIHLRWIPLVLAGLTVQLTLFAAPVAERVGDLGPWVYVTSTVLVLVAILRNVQVPGLAIVAAGAAANLSAIVANGGYMPASPAALAASGHVVSATYSNSASVLNPALEWLIDRFALPTWVPFANVFSIGDLVISVGIMATVMWAMRSATLEPA
jgi:hypothetical protein